MELLDNLAFANGSTGSSPSEMSDLWTNFKDRRAKAGPRIDRDLPYRTVAEYTTQEDSDTPFPS